MAQVQAVVVNIVVQPGLRASNWQLACTDKDSFGNVARGGEHERRLCISLWGQQDAASELLRAVNSADPDLGALASAMLAQREETRHPLAEPTI